MSKASKQSINDYFGEDKEDYINYLNGNKNWRLGFCCLEIGSPKQKVWAERIRFDLLSKLLDYRKMIVDEHKMRRGNFYRDRVDGAIASIKKIVSAEWFIARRSDTIRELLEYHFTEFPWNLR